jgi:ABC-2 type transport system ATP-binding protein
MDPVLSVNNIKMSFGEHTVLDGISFSVQKNSIFGLVGRSGAGKTTLMRIITGFYTPTSGSMRFAGVEDNLSELKKHIGFVTQNNCFYDELSCLENLYYFASLYDIEKKTSKRNSRVFVKKFKIMGCTRKKSCSS